MNEALACDMMSCVLPRHDLRGWLFSLSSVHRLIVPFGIGRTSCFVCLSFNISRTRSMLGLREGENNIFSRGGKTRVTKFVRKVRKRVLPFCPFYFLSFIYFLFIYYWSCLFDYLFVLERGCGMKTWPINERNVSRVFKFSRKNITI